MKKVWLPLTTLAFLISCVSHSDSVFDYMKTLDDNQVATAQKSFEDEARFNWHYVPRKTRHGLRIDKMNDQQRADMNKFLKMAFSDKGFYKAMSAIEHEKILYEFENQRAFRDPGKYYFTQYGTAGKGKWGFGFEGHHLSTNFTFQDNTLISCTPMFIGANPARALANKTSKLKVGEEPLKDEVEMAINLVKTFDNDQKKLGWKPEIAERDMSEGGKKKPGSYDDFGISWAQLKPAQQEALLRLLKNAYYANINKGQVTTLWKKLEAKKESLKFSFYGTAVKDKQFHYRIQSKTLVIMLYNVQNGAKNSPANHIHAVWRDRNDDFGLN